MLTPTGRVIGIVGPLLVAAGMLLGYPELIAIGSGCLLALAMAVLYLLVRSRVEVRRTVEPVRVSVGEPASAVLLATNVGRRRSSPVQAVERVAGEQIAVRVPSLARGDSHEATYALPTDRRGVLTVGPLTIGQADPFRLVQSTHDYGVVARLFVHPRLVDLAPSPAGRARELEGPAAATAPRGGVVFHSLREYVRGDDLRLVHWKSTAKTGTLMVRHNVVATDPRLVVVLDTSHDPYTEASFEDAVVVAASLVKAGVEANFPTEVRTTGGSRVAVSPRAESITSAMDLLAGVSRSPEDRGLRELVRIDPAEQGALLCVVTGIAAPDKLSAITTVRSRYEMACVVQLGASSQTRAAIVGAINVAAEDLGDLVALWNRRFRR